MGNWDDAKIEKLTKLWGEGYSSGQIVRLLDGEFTRSAVIGKVHRLGLSGRVTITRVNSNHLPGVKAKPTGRISDMKPNPARERRRVLAEMRREPIPPPAETDVVRVRKLVDLESHHCRWPINEPHEKNFGFCGDQKAFGTSYCRHHLLRSSSVPATLAEKQKSHVVYRSPKSKVFEDA